jgi:hypothetical protein
MNLMNEEEYSKWYYDLIFYRIITHQPKLTEKITLKGTLECVENDTDVVNNANIQKLIMLKKNQKVLDFIEVNSTLYKKPECILWFFILMKNPKIINSYCKFVIDVYGEKFFYETISPFLKGLFNNNPNLKVYYAGTENY